VRSDLDVSSGQRRPCGIEGAVRRFDTVSGGPGA